jgi:hypothetical protein
MLRRTLRNTKQEKENLGVKERQKGQEKRKRKSPQKGRPKGLSRD